jgi:hypothetical protein
MPRAQAKAAKRLVSPASTLWMFLSCVSLPDLPGVGEVWSLTGSGVYLLACCLSGTHLVRMVCTRAQDMERIVELEKNWLEGASIVLPRIRRY